jgi:hypothetical protein
LSLVATLIEGDRIIDQSFGVQAKLAAEFLLYELVNPAAFPLALIEGIAGAVDADWASKSRSHD